MIRERARGTHPLNQLHQGLGLELLDPGFIHTCTVVYLGLLFCFTHTGCGVFWNKKKQFAPWPHLGHAPIALLLGALVLSAIKRSRTAHQGSKQGLSRSRCVTVPGHSLLNRRCSPLSADHRKEGYAVLLPVRWSGLQMCLSLSWQHGPPKQGRSGLFPPANMWPKYPHLVHGTKAIRAQMAFHEKRARAGPKFSRPCVLNLFCISSLRGQAGCPQTWSWLRGPSAISLPKTGKQYLSSSRWDTQENLSSFPCP